MRLVFCLITFLSALTQTTSGQNALPEAYKRHIVRIENPEGFLGTGFVLASPDIGFFLVTGKHVVTSCNTGRVFDSVFVRQNLLSSGGKVTSSAIRCVIHLRSENTDLYRAHADTSVDLVIVPLGTLSIASGKVVVNHICSDSITGFKMKSVATKDVFDSGKFEEGTEVQVVGFSFQTLDKPQFHISRFGRLSVLTESGITIPFRSSCPKDTVFHPCHNRWLVLDLTSRGGDSGAPVFSLNDAELIGFVQATSQNEELCFAVPSYFIWDLVRDISSLLKK